MGLKSSAPALSGATPADSQKESVKGSAETARVRNRMARTSSVRLPVISPTTFLRSPGCSQWKKFKGSNNFTGTENEIFSNAQTANR
jgi:hypothetical protein